MLKNLLKVEYSAFYKLYNIQYIIGKSTFKNYDKWIIFIIYIYKSLN